jgi:hypothetical protein
MAPLSLAVSSVDRAACVFLFISQFQCSTSAFSQRSLGMTPAGLSLVFESFRVRAEDL